MQESFKINVFFNQQGEEIEDLLAHYFIQMLNEKNLNLQNRVI